MAVGESDGIRPNSTRIYSSPAKTGAAGLLLSGIGSLAYDHSYVGDFRNKPTLGASFAVAAVCGGLDYVSIWRRADSAVRAGQ